MARAEVTVRTPTSLTGNGGFTLIELLVVIAIMAVLSAMAVPQMAGAWGSASLRSSARDLLLAARYARDYAVTRRVRTRLVLAAGEGTYHVDAQRVEEGRGPGEFTPLGTTHGRRRKLPAGIRLGPLRVDPRGRSADPAGSTVAVTFEPTGQADAAVIIIADHRQRWTLRIAPSSGRAELLEGEVIQALDDRKDLDE